MKAGRACSSPQHDESLFIGTSLLKREARCLYELDLDASLFAFLSWYNEFQGLLKTIFVTYAFATGGASSRLFLRLCEGLWTASRGAACRAGFSAPFK